MIEPLKEYQLKSPQRHSLDSGVNSLGVKLWKKYIVSAIKILGVLYYYKMGFKVKEMSGTGD